MNRMAETRADFVSYVRRQLVGPFGGEHEIIYDPPNRRYLMGILFPAKVPYLGEGTDDYYPDEHGAEYDGDESQHSDGPVSAANDFLPASQGISFFTTATSIVFSARASEYEMLTGEPALELLLASEASDGGPTEPSEDRSSGEASGATKIWRRRPLPEVQLVITPDQVTPLSIWDNRAAVHVRWRSLPSGNLVTVTLMNSRVNDGDREQAWSEMLLQAEFEVSVSDPGEVLEYPSAALVSRDVEEEEFRLVYRNARVFAIGHGCSPEWTVSAGTVRSVRSEVMPTALLPSFVAEGETSLACNVAWLADESITADELVRELGRFVDPYERWIGHVKNESKTLDARFSSAADSIIGRLDRAHIRLRAGIRIFAEHHFRAELIRAFRLANKAMLIQMRHSSTDLTGSRHARDFAPDIPTVYPEGAEWRPFQLAFFLTTLTGLADPSHEDREVVDLIWFPTGGGKTEAYLLVAAFEIFRRRLLEGEHGGGTTIISRYTLSLLTAQQFQRTAATVVACEHLRRRSNGGLGSEPISVGLWVGEATTPNRYIKARERYEDLRAAGETDDRFLLDRCPWCGTEIVPRLHTDNDADYGISATDGSFKFFCTSEKCEFNDELPVHVIDDALYDCPPTFVLATVDKFAQLAWVAKAGALFGHIDGKLPPSLVIQDELHLLTGPLGTTFGAYETAINLLCATHGRPAKIIASTATIRRASSQISGLFGRSVDLFPPSGIDDGDSYFARAGDAINGRLYIGMMPQGHSSVNSVVHVGAALLQAPVDLELSGEERDAYWTVVAYHVSLRELGRTVTLARDAIDARIRSLVVGRAQRTYDVDELSSAVPRSQQPRLLERLNLSCADSNSVGLLATTNMLSVGVDVPRLGLMLMNGQPKGTTEYIQATSRVGRSTVPGLVFGLFRSTVPRDRSHYENFQSYHAALYRHVEPTSVTPFSQPSRSRSLHAALVILVRHKLGLAADGRAGEVAQRTSEVRQLATSILDAVNRVEPREVAGTKADLERIVDHWFDRANQAAASGKLLYYSSNGKGHFHLIKRYNTKGDAWPTLDSLRNVDFESLLDIGSGEVVSRRRRSDES